MQLGMHQERAEHGKNQRDHPPFRTRRLRDPTIPYEQPAFRRKKAPECV